MNRLFTKLSVSVLNDISRNWLWKWVEISKEWLYHELGMRVQFDEILNPCKILEIYTEIPLREMCVQKIKWHCLRKSFSHDKQNLESYGVYLINVRFYMIKKRTFN